MTSTAGVIREDIYDQEYEEAEKLINGYEDPDGYHDDHTIYFIYELDNRSEWTDPKCWKKANPGLGTIKNYKTLADKVKKAMQNPALVKNLVCKEFSIRETSSEKWFASMYDMDSTWGLWWTGASFVATDYDRSEYQDFKDGEGNLLYIRLEELFYEELQARWAELRSGALSIENIINRFERFTDIAPAELVKEDYASTTGDGKFTGIPSKTTSTIQQIRGYAVARHAWCDTYVAALAGGGEVEPDEPDVPETVPCIGITLSTSSLTFTGAGSQTLVATVEPSDATDSVVWSVTPAGIATVSGGVVTAIANGSCTITATCGEQSATCAVSVNMEQINILESVTWEDGHFNGNTGIDIADANLRRTSYFDISAYAGESVVLVSNEVQYLNTIYPAYMTQQKIEVEGGKTYSLYNKEGGTFQYKGIVEYKADGTFIKFKQQEGTTEAHTDTLDAETAYVYLIAGAQGTDPNNYLEFTLVE